MSKPTQGNLAVDTTTDSASPEPSSQRAKSARQRFAEREHVHELRWDNLDWTTVIGISVMHLLCIPAIWFFSWSGLLLMIVLWWISGGLGVCLGFHRLFTHRSFHTPRVVECTLAIFGSLAWQGSPIRWVGVHRLHHAESDQEADPHSPQHGFTWAHMLWCMVRDHDGNDPAEFAKDLQRDPFLRWLDRWFVLPQIVLAMLLFGSGWLLTGTWVAGVSWVLWGTAVRVVFTYHMTWFVNSAAHTWGYRNFDTTDNSRNTWWVALLSFGEGWHNNHHAQQRSAAHGMKWWEIDPTWLTILVMEKVGLATRVVRPKLDDTHTSGS